MGQPHRPSSLTVVLDPAGPPVLHRTGIVREQLAFWKPVSDSQNRLVTYSSPPGPIWVAIEPQSLRTALDALLSNIFRHTPSGTGYQLEVSTHRSRVEIRVHNLRADTVDDDLPGSTGMGLEIVQQIIQDADGEIDLQDQSSTEFTVTIKLRHLHALHPSPRAVSSARRRQV